ncbi:MAG TPA: hypothetical protein VGF17_14275, partial [Phytomonospora sp.]
MVEEPLYQLPDDPYSPADEDLPPGEDDTVHPGPAPTAEEPADPRLGRATRALSVQRRIAQSRANSR